MNTVILRTTAALLVRPIALLSIYYLVRGHNAPGGGFIAALVAGAGLLLMFYAEITPSRLVAPVLRFEVLVPAGAIVAVLAGLVPLLLGNAFMSGGGITVWLPLVGDQKLTLSLLFDVGVYLTVLGMVSAIIDSLGEEDPQ